MFKDKNYSTACLLAAAMLSLSGCSEQNTHSADSADSSQSAHSVHSADSSQTTHNVHSADSSHVVVPASGSVHIASNVQEPIKVIATTPILADLARQVAGDRAEVHSLIPPGADPHTYEPSLRDVREVVYAQVALSNYLMLEPHAVIKTLDANLQPSAKNISIAEASTQYGSQIIALVENINLDTLWLGLRVRGTGKKLGATRSSEVELSITNVHGPGNMAAYITQTFGQPHIFSSSHDGFQPGDGYAQDTTTLPTDAHTHMSWAFTKPGIYNVTMKAALRVTPSTAPIVLPPATITFAVGPDPQADPRFNGYTVLDIGHADITADLDTQAISIIADPVEKAEDTQNERILDPEKTVLWVPPKAITEVPAQRAFGFLGKIGAQIFQLPQAVLGAHVHGEIDPHLWMSVRNTQAYIEVIREALSDVDRDGAAVYGRNAREYSNKLVALDNYVQKKIATIPQANRHLVTTHDAYGYFANEYGLTVSGFVAPNPGIEPSLAQRKKISETLRQLQIPAVFIEPNLGRQTSTLEAIANEANVNVCTIYGDTFDKHVQSYVELMRFNADSLAECLGGEAVHEQQ